MALIDQRFVRSEGAVREAGYMALVKSLGYADALRFIAQLSTGAGDYLAWQDQVFAETSVSELYKAAKKHWEEQGKPA